MNKEHLDELAFDVHGTIVRLLANSKAANCNGERHQMMLGKHPNLLGVDQEILRLPACFRLSKPKKMMATKAVAVQIW